MASVGWAVAYLVVSIAGLALVANAWRPPRSERLAVAAFVAGWPMSELPLWHIAMQAAATAGFAALGAFGSWPGWAGLVVAAVGWVGLALLAVQGARAHAVLDRAAQEVPLPLPPAPPLPRTGRDTMWRLPRLLYPFPRPARSMRMLRNVDYTGDGRRSHRLDIIVRRSDPPQAAPVLVYIHGGSWMIGDKREQGLPMLHELARRGWVTVTVNYESPGMSVGEFRDPSGTDAHGEGRVRSVRA